jgi:hypothetical protein
VVQPIYRLKPVQLVPVLNTVGNFNTLVSIIILIYIIIYNIIHYIMGPPSYMRSVVDQIVVMLRTPLVLSSGVTVKIFRRGQ